MVGTKTSFTAGNIMKSTVHWISSVLIADRCFGGFFSTDFKKMSKAQKASVFVKFNPNYVRPDQSRQM